MKKEQKKDKQYGSVYEFEGRIPLKRALPLGIQHVLAMFLANISPLMIVCGLLDIALDLRTSLIQNAMFVAAIATLLQLYPVWKLGSRLPIVMGTSSSFISTAGVIGASAGYGAIVGACIVGSVMELILGYFIKPLRKLFPPLVTSLVIMAIGLTLLPVGISYFGGGSGAADFGSPNHLLVGTFVIIVILIAKQFKGWIADASILVGIVAGYVLAICLGMVDFSPLADAAWFALPKFMPVMPTFDLQAIIAMCILFVATAVETVGNISGITNGAFDREPTPEEMRGGVMADSVGSLFGSFFGVLPVTTFAQNVGLVVVSRIVAAVRVLPEDQRAVFDHAAVGAGRRGRHHVLDDRRQRHSGAGAREDGRAHRTDHRPFAGTGRRHRQHPFSSGSAAGMGEHDLCAEQHHHDLRGGDGAQPHLAEKESA